MNKRFERMVANVKAQLGAAMAYVAKHPVRTGLLVLTPLLGVAAVVKLLGLIVGLMTMTAEAVAAFLDRYLISMIIAAAIVWRLTAWWGQRKEEREVRERREREQARARCIREYETTKEATYTKQGKMLFSVAREMGGMGLVLPTRLSNLYSPTHTIPIDGGAAMLCQFLIKKEPGDIDTEEIKSTMQTKINQRLSAGEFPGVKEQHIYDGRVYSGVVIHHVGDAQGFIEVYTAFVNDAYCRYVQEQELGKDTLPPAIDRRDTDY